MEKFRIIHEKKEILELITNSVTEGYRGEIWQTSKDKRFHYQIKNIIDDEINKIIVFESDQKLDFNISEDVYIRIFHRDLIFKLEKAAYVCAGKKIASPYPDTAKAIETRGLSRINLPIEMDIRVSLKPLGESAIGLIVQLVDISRGGLGIIISETNSEFLKRNKVFKILKINDLELTGHNEVTVSYLKKRKNGTYKSGLILKNPFIESIFDFICKEIFSKS